MRRATSTNLVCAGFALLSGMAFAQDLPVSPQSKPMPARCLSADDAMSAMDSLSSESDQTAGKLREKKIQLDAAVQRQRLRGVESSGMLSDARAAPDYLQLKQHMDARMRLSGALLERFKQFISIRDFQGACETVHELSTVNKEIEVVAVGRYDFLLKKVMSFEGETSP